MIFLNLILLFGLQAPAQTVVVGLNDGQQLVLQNPQFSGFIQNRDGGAVLMYRQAKFHGEVALGAVSRIDFGEYRKGRPLPLTLTLKNGQKIEVEAERQDFVLVKGTTDLGTVTIKHPDPLSAPVRLTTKRPNRQNDLTIQYLEFPGS